MKHRGQPSPFPSETSQWSALPWIHVNLADQEQLLQRQGKARQGTAGRGRVPAAGREGHDDREGQGLDRRDVQDARDGPSPLPKPQNATMTAPCRHPLNTLYGVCINFYLYILYGFCTARHGERGLHPPQSSLVGFYWWLFSLRVSLGNAHTLPQVRVRAPVCLLCTSLLLSCRMHVTSRRTVLAHDPADPPVKHEVSLLPNGPWCQGLCQSLRYDCT
jgi:hypothetical protein